MIQYFENNPWLNIISFLLAIIGLIMAYYFYIKSIKEKVPVFNTQTLRLLQPKLSELKHIEIKFNDIKVTNLSLTKIAFWNDGHDPIYQKDITVNDPLMIIISEPFQIYDVEISYKKAVNNFDFKLIDNKEIHFKFDYLDLKDGIVFNIYHNGYKSDELNIKGTLIGSRKINRAVQKNYILNSLDILFKPANFFMERNGWFSQSVGGIVALISLLIIFPMCTVILPLNYLHNKFKLDNPKEYNITD